MDSLRKKLKAYTDLQCPITGPGVQRLEDLLRAIVERLEPEVEGCCCVRHSQDDDEHR